MDTGEGTWIAYLPDVLHVIEQYFASFITTVTFDCAMSDRKSPRGFCGQN